MGGHEVKEQEVLEILGFLVDNKGNWSNFAEATASAARQRLGALRRLAPLLDDDCINMVYKTFVRSKIEYGSLVYWGAADGHLRDLDAIQPSAPKLLQKPEQVAYSRLKVGDRLLQWASRANCLMAKGVGC